MVIYKTPTEIIQIIVRHAFKVGRNNGAFAFYIVKGFIPLV